ncbi:MAG TPA: hypothetical protein VM253_07055 [Candidatus Limnocylindrales bacterium]|nr:hypothetical protein [Candidatus Limnocylindrales bacterium]
MSTGADPVESAAGDVRGSPQIGGWLVGTGNRRIGRIDAVFADYLLVRTAGLLPVDLYVPRPETTGGGQRVRVQATRDEAYARWHRPLKRAPHD